MKKSAFFTYIRKSLGIESISQLTLFRAVCQSLIEANARDGSAFKVAASGGNAGIAIPARPLTVAGRKFSTPEVDAIARTIGKYDTAATDRNFKEMQERTALLPS